MATGDEKTEADRLAAEIGQRVYQARVAPRPGKRKGFTQKALAALSGIAQGRISEIESGAFDGRALLTIRDLCRALGVPFGATVAGEGERQPQRQVDIPPTPHPHREALDPPAEPHRRRNSGSG